MSVTVTSLSKTNKPYNRFHTTNTHSPVYFQAKLPELRKDVRPSEMPEKMADLEELKWRPKSVLDGDLMMYLRAARSVCISVTMIV